MGFKSKLNKMKSFLFDEEEEVKEIEKPALKKAKKEVINKKAEVIKEDNLSKAKEVEELYFEDISDSDSIISNDIKPRNYKKEKEFNFPEFDEDDFMVSNKKPEPIIPVVKEEPKRALYQGSKRKEETKKFKPSPIISPIYGLLDEEGKEITKKGEASDLLSNNKDDMTFDEVRKKAYGKIDEEIENTIKKLSKKTIEEAEKDLEKEELSRAKKNKKESVKKDAVIIPKEDDEDDDDDMILPNINFREIDVNKEKEKIENKTLDEDDDDDTKEQDLFNLIDTMYSKEEDKD